MQVAYWRKRKPNELGAYTEVIPADLRQQLQRNTGAYVVAIEEGSPAFLANILVGDVIVAMNGISVTSPQDVALRSPAATNTIELLRTGTVKTIHVPVPSQTGTKATETVEKSNQLAAAKENTEVAAPDSILRSDSLNQGTYRPEVTDSGSKSQLADELLDKAGELAFKEATADEAIALANQALRASGGDKDVNWEAKLTVAVAHGAKGEVDIAESLIGELLESVAIPEGNFALQAQSHLTLGVIYSMNQLGKHATESIKRALNIQLEHSAAVAADLTLEETMFWLARVLTQEDEYEESQHHLVRALAILDSKSAPDDELRIDVLDELSDTKLMLGKLRESANHAKRAMTLKQATYPTQPYRLSTNLMVLGIIDAKMGTYQSSREYFGRALESQIATLGASHPDIAITLTMLAGVCELQGKRRDALNYLEQLEALYDAPDFPDSERVFDEGDDRVEVLKVFAKGITDGEMRE